MGYQSNLSGELEIKPPLKWAEYRETAFLSGDGVLLELAESISQADTEDGSVTIRAAARVVPYGDSVKAYTLKEDLSALVRAFPGHTFHGYIVRDGEDTGDVERYWIEDGGVKSEAATLRWLDGSEVEL